MDNHYLFITKTAEDTKELGEKLIGKLIESGSNTPAVCLYGNLGSGKTTFTQGVARGLGIDKRILSPTYIIVRRYKIKGIKKFLAHIDAYRLKDAQNDSFRQVSEIINNPENLVVIEWADYIAGILPKKRIDIYFRVLKDGSHEIKLKKK